VAGGPSKPGFVLVAAFRLDKMACFFETFFKTSDVNAKAFSRLVNTQGVTNEDEKVRQL
jgi:hypothetical protein